MERLERLFNESKDELNNINISLKKGITCSISNSKGRLGCCKSKRKIEISNYMLQFNDTTIKDTIIHELLHTLDDTKGHDTKWKWYASKVNKAYKQYNITRLGNLTEMCKSNGIQQEKIIQYKYIITCKKCGRKIHRHKLSQWQKQFVVSNFKCKCGGHNTLQEN